MFVSAGAGTGKTAVLVERFVRAVCDRGLDVESILVITYTARAAGELRGTHPCGARRARSARPRARARRRVDLDHPRVLPRLLRSHPFAAGVDPRFRVLDESQGRVLRSEAFAAALGRFCEEDEDERLRLLAVYGADHLRRMLIGVFETLRAAGRELTLELGDGPSSRRGSRSCATRPAASRMTPARPPTCAPGG